MKILQVNCVYHRGSTAKIMYDIHTELVKNDYESVICYGRGPKTHDTYVYKTCTVVLNIGRVDSQEELARYYAMADVTLLPSKKETFSMVTAESLCCGTPVVGFKAGGPETIALEEYSTFVDYADIDSFENALKNELERKCDAFEISQKAKAMYKNSEMTAGYIEVYNRLLGAKIS